jgi:uncharacterized MAPEG superfamily protein
MMYVDLVAILALLEFVVFATLCGRARGRYQVLAPATSGHPMFERYYRVQMNTLELLIIVLPGLYIAARYWNPHWCAFFGAVYLIGRIVYFRAYIKEPKSRSLGYALSAGPALILLVAPLVGMVRTLSGL